MLLENQLRLFQMQKGEEIDPFLIRLQGIRDQLASVGATPDVGFMVRTALNAVTEDWENFFQRILGKATLPSWEEMWETDAGALSTSQQCRSFVHMLWLGGFEILEL